MKNVAKNLLLTSLAATAFACNDEDADPIVTPVTENEISGTITQDRTLDELNPVATCDMFRSV